MEHNGRPDFIYINSSLPVPIVVPHLKWNLEPSSRSGYSKIKNLILILVSVLKIKPGFGSGFELPTTKLVVICRLGIIINLSV
jgi:hypothetical protein